MNRTLTLIVGGVIFAAALAAAVLFSDRGTPDPTEGAPANVPAAPVTPQ
ncbi:hypothetical protein [Aquabacter spiritensis]|uniref:Uncharacterized protein n=1 Tax=Aquabacter spiritensis TaxID=933073 RepID=A0A4R3LSJ5_9HYPH|nr:hypothetical protein [Aquabacter spiritensis]TCT03534.1 hypothetical protein EDC64_10984 [Aquabacter spiritensis]